MGNYREMLGKEMQYTLWVIANIQVQNSLSTNLICNLLDNFETLIFNSQSPRVALARIDKWDGLRAAPLS